MPQRSHKEPQREPQTTQKRHPIPIGYEQINGATCTELTEVSEVDLCSYLKVVKREL